MRAFLHLANRHITIEDNKKNNENSDLKAK